MLVAVYVVDTEVGLPPTRWISTSHRVADGGVVGFGSVVAVGGFASAAVDPDQADVAGFEEPVEMDCS